MKIRAIRLRELGCFTEPVALEGLSGGLDVLTGPNELGKSTILKALHTLFTVRHSTQSRSIESLRPYSGGAPLIEADFEVDGKLWRLRKQYVSDRQALLMDLGSGKVVARGDEAHQRALELLQCNGKENGLGLLWVKQRASFEPVELDEEERSLLSRVIEREIAVASSGGHDLRAIREKILQQRRGLVTDSRSRPTGAYAAAISKLDETQRELEAARAEAQKAADRLSRAEELRARRASLKDPAANAELDQRITGLKKRCDEAAEARNRLKVAEAKVEACVSRQTDAERARDLLAGKLKDAGELEAAIAAAQDKRRGLEEDLASLDSRVTAARARRDRARSDLTNEQRRLQARLELDRRREAERQLTEASQRLAEARRAAQRIEEIGNLLALNTVTEQRVGAAMREARSIETLEARISAQLPKVRIAYEPGGVGKLVVDGRPLADGAVLTPSRPLTIRIAGIGTIAIDPAVSESVEEDKADLEAHRAVLEELLAEMGVAELEEARQRLEERQQLEREQAQAADRLATRAPHGLEQLTKEVDRLTALVARQPNVAFDADLPERAVIEAALDRLGQELQAAEEVVEQIAAEHAKVREALARHIAESHARAERLAILNAELPPSEQRAEALAAAEAQLAAATEALNEAIRERTAWQEKAPDEASFGALQAELSEAQRQQHNRAEQLIELERDLAVLEREIERDGQDGLTARINELEERVATYREQVRHYEREVAALDLLLATLDEVERHSRERYFSPVVKRLEPYLHLLFPNAAISFGQDLSVEAIARGAAREQLRALSDGTQEQIAVLVRLAFARLLADAGRPTPLILDDALVYSDDERIEALFQALRHASQAHQVIVFTCRSRTFEQLGGTRLQLVPWAA
nr:MAG: hypothetical protein DIU57_08850 [Pseudomonadota bacterium]